MRRSGRGGSVDGQAAKKIARPDKPIRLTAATTSSTDGTIAGGGSGKMDAKYKLTYVVKSTAR